MSRFTKNIFVAVLAVVLLTTHQGCIFLVVGAAAGAAAYSADGILRTNEGKSMPDVWQATLEAVQDDLKYPVTQANESPSECVLHTVGPSGKKVKIWLVPFSANVTDLRIQVGLLGNEPISRSILREIRANY